jgi:3-oxoacyl-[acyl-carrier protein] reductase
MGQLDGRVAIVTGSGGGIGRAVAQAFAREGARVAVNGRTAANVEETVKLIKSAKGEAIGAAGDVSEHGVAERIVRAAVDRWGAVDVLVNNAAIAGPVAPLGKEDIGEWWKTQQINILGPFLMTRAAIAAMRKKPLTPGGAPRGKVIDVSSGAGRGFAGDLVPYRVSKAGLLRLSTALAAHLQPEGIEVNTVDVFATTPMVIAMGRMDDQDPALAARMRKRAVSQEPTPEDNAPVFVWLASSKSDGVTGRNFGWNMNVEDLDRVRPRLIADPRALRIEMVPMEGIGLSPQARAYQDRVAAMHKKG